MDNHRIIKLLNECCETYEMDEPPVIGRYCTKEEFNDWSMQGWVYEEIRSMIGTLNDEDAIGLIERYCSKAISMAQESKHRDLFMKMYYISEDLLQIIAEEMEY